MNLHALTPPADLPATDARIPVLVIQAALATVGILLTLLVYGANGWMTLGVAFSLLAACMPQYLLSWVLIVFLAIGQLARPAGLTWQLLVLIVGVHLLHLLGMLVLALPGRSLLQPRALKQPLLRLVAIQIPVQVLTVFALLLFAPNTHGHRPLTIDAFPIIGAIALVALALLLLTRRAETGTSPAQELGSPTETEALGAN